jgi:hypothetical protein
VAAGGWGVPIPWSGDAGDLPSGYDDAEWESWTGMVFPVTREYVAPDALNPSPPVTAARDVLQGQPAGNIRRPG